MNDLIESLKGNSYALPSLNGEWVDRGGDSVPYNVCIEAMDVLEALRWKPIDTAPTDGTIIEVYAVERDLWPDPKMQLPPMISLCAYHPDAGFCVCEIRQPTHWRHHFPPIS